MVIGISLFHIKTGLEHKNYFPFNVVPRSIQPGAHQMTLTMDYFIRLIK